MVVAVTFIVVVLSGVDELRTGSLKSLVQGYGLRRTLSRIRLSPECCYKMKGGNNEIIGVNR